MIYFYRMRKFFLILLSIPALLPAQDLSGIWKGYIEVNGSDMAFELVISQSGEKFRGYSMSSLLVEGVENIGIKEAEIKKKKDRYLFEDGELVFNNFSTPGKRIILTASLQYDAGSKHPELNGNFRTRSLDMRDKTSYSGKIHLRKTEDQKGSSLLARLQLMKLTSDSGELLTWANGAKDKKDKDKDLNPRFPMENPGSTSSGSKSTAATRESNAKSGQDKKAVTKAGKKSSENNALTKTLSSQTKEQSVSGNEQKSTDPFAAIKFRKAQLIHEFYFTGDSLELNFYDNGTIDGDTISVLLDNKLIISKEQLGNQAIQRKVSIPASTESVYLTMLAENLGLYPPNTGILVMKDGKSRVEIRFMGDLENNPVIKLTRKK